MLASSLVLVAFGPWLTAWQGQAVQPGLRPAGAPGSAGVAQTGAQDSRPTLSVALPPQSITLPTGEVADFGAHQVWRPLCAGSPSVTREDLELMRLGHEALMRRNPRVLDTTPAQGIGSFNVVFVTSGSLPPGASAALAAAEAYIESFYSDPMTITINCSFQPLGPGILGSTGSSYGWVNYGPMRTQLVNDRDASDTIQSFLPTTSTCPVRYTTGSTVTNETRVFTTFANWKAVDGTVSGADANMTFSTNFAFDYDPTNGITAGSYSFRDIIIHETGHAMGFTSGVDFRFNDMEVLDLF